MHKTNKNPAIASFRTTDLDSYCVYRPVEPMTMLCATRGSGFIFHISGVTIHLNQEENKRGRKEKKREKKKERGHSDASNLLTLGV